MSSTDLDKSLEEIYARIEGLGSEIELVDAVFGFLQRRTNFFNNPRVLKTVQKIANKHFNEAQQVQIREKKEADASKDDDEEVITIERPDMDEEATETQTKPEDVKNTEKQDKDDDERGPRTIEGWGWRW